MKKFALPLICFMAISSLVGCTDNDDYINGTDNKTRAEEETQAKYSYDDPDGVFIVNCGDRKLDNGFLTYIAPDGTVEEDVYKKVNNSELGNEARAMYICDGKLYILCREYFKNSGNGVLFICDAKTLKKEKVYHNDDFKFDLPKDMDPENPNNYGTGFQSPENIVVLDERNIFIVDTQGLFRFDSTTGETVLLKGSYGLGNSNSSIQTAVSKRCITVMNDKVYIQKGGFWASFGIQEYEKGKNEVSRELEIPGKFTRGSALLHAGNNQLWLAAYNLNNTTKGMLYKVDAQTMTLSNEQMEIDGNIYSGLESSPGISISGNYIYFNEKGLDNRTGGNVISRYDMDMHKTKSTYIDVTKDEPLAKVMRSCNPIINPKNNYLYAPTSEIYQEAIEGNENLLIYDCSGDEPKLIENIANKTNDVAGIYFVYQFYENNKSNN